MRLTTFTDYSLRVLMFVATQREGRATIANIASAYGISENHLVKVVHRLGKEGLLCTTRGRGGGLALARPAAEINIGHVVRLTEGADMPAECFGNESEACAIARICRLAGVLDQAVKAFYDVLDRFTLQDITQNRRALAAILHTQPRAA